MESYELSLVETDSRVLRSKTALSESRRAKRFRMGSHERLDLPPKLLTLSTLEVGREKTTKKVGRTFPSFPHSHRMCALINIDFTPLSPAGGERYTIENKNN